ncbi:tyrosine-type recombinase/integrase [Arthrobacter sp. KK5.5]|uniref:tyrosine-type recombinase/integrase n=1 Tax=Arthrobacter sp. KK5.5 TaxID=3373084 RepID=UPI003EE7457C
MSRERKPVGEIGKVVLIELDTKKWKATGRYRGRDGLLHRASAEGTSRDRATAELRRTALKRAGKSDGLGKKSPTVKDAMAGWVEGLNVVEKDAVVKPSGFITPATFRQYTHSAAVVNALLGNVLLADLEPLVIETSLASLVDRDGSSGASKARMALVVLRLTLAQTKRLRLLPDNPARDVRLPRPRRNPPEAPTVEAVELLRELIELRKNARMPGPVPNARLGQVVDLILGTSMRISEVMALRWADIDFEERRLTCSGAMIEGQGPMYRQSYGKNSKAFRTMALPDFAWRSLESIRSEFDPAPATAPVFQTRTGSFTAPSAIRRPLRALSAFANSIEFGRIGPVNPHAYRKAVATLLAKHAGLPAAQEQLGHEDEDTTRVHYVAPADEITDRSELLSAFAPRPKSTSGGSGPK